MKKKILNPNCSELIMRLDISKKEALEELEEIGIKEIELTNGEFWGKNAFGNKDKKEKWLADRDNPNIPDFKNTATLAIDKGDINSNKKEKDKCTIVAHQHCQHQLFPTLKKIENHLGVEWEAYDGGSIEEYDGWLETGDDIPNHQDEETMKKRARLVMNHFFTGKCSICGTKENKKVCVKKGWKFCMECNRECCPKCVKKGKSEKGIYFFCSQECMNKAIAERL